MNFRLTITVLIAVCLCTGTLAQSDWRLSIPFGFTGGPNLARMDIAQGVTWRQGLGGVMTGQAGIGFRYKERIGGTLEFGALLDYYQFGNGPVEYAFMHAIVQYRTNFFYQIPRKKYPGSFLKFDMDFGYIPFSEGESMREDLGSQVVETITLGPVRWFIAPGIGVAENLDNGNISLSLTYHYNFGGGGTTLTTFRKEGPEVTTAEGMPNFFGVKMRMMLDVRGHKPYRTPTVVPPKEFYAFMQRETRVKRQFKSKREKVVLKLYDNAEIDGDTISVMVNGQYVLAYYALTKKKKKIKIQLEEGQNEVVIYAHNEGRISPNTAACEFRSGLRRERFMISTALDRNESILIDY